MKLSYNVLIALSVLVASSMVGDSEAATYVVGDSLGWQVPTGGASDYSAWASQHVFRTGDVLVFNFTTGFHDVARVSRQAFDSCSSSNPITLVTVGPASFTLNSTGSDYYICTFGSHCSLGQQLEINVTSSASPPSPSPIPNPSPAPSTPNPSPAPSTPNPSPAPSSPQAPTPTPSTVPQPPPSSMSPGPSPNGPVTPSPISPGTESAPRPPASNPIPINQPPPPPPNAAPVVGFGSPVVVMACVLLSLIMV